MEEIKPCPFCGGDAEVEQMGSGRQSMIIACTQCGCRLESSDTFLGPHCSWNTRTDAEVDVAKAKLRHVCEIMATLGNHGLNDVLLEMHAYLFPDADAVRKYAADHP